METHAAFLILIERKTSFYAEEMAAGNVGSPCRRTRGGRGRGHGGVCPAGGLMDSEKTPGDSFARRDCAATERWTVFFKNPPICCPVETLFVFLLINWYRFWPQCPYKDCHESSQKVRPECTVSPADRMQQVKDVPRLSLFYDAFRGFDGGKKWCVSISGLCHTVLTLQRCVVICSDLVYAENTGCGFLFCFFFCWEKILNKLGHVRNECQGTMFRFKGFILNHWCHGLLQEWPCPWNPNFPPFNQSVTSYRLLLSVTGQSEKRLKGFQNEAAFILVQVSAAHIHEFPESCTFMLDCELENG